MLATTLRSATANACGASGSSTGQVRTSRGAPSCLCVRCARGSATPPPFRALPPPQRGVAREADARGRDISPRLLETEREAIKLPGKLARPCVFVSRRGTPALRALKEEGAG